MFESFHQWALHYTFLGIPAWRWLVAATTAALGTVVTLTALRLLAGALGRRHLVAVRALGAAARHTRWWLVLLAFLALGAQALGLSDRADRYIGLVGAVAVAVQVGLWANSLVHAWTTQTLAAEGGQAHNPVVLSMMSWFARIMVWATLLLAALSVAGVNITAFVASLGVGGVAVALALQSILGDLFASMSIGLDKPFEIGQFITFGDVAGTIVHVGVKTTRIKSLSGEEIVIGNSELLGNTLHNYARMQERRIVFSFGVTYDTDAATMRAIPDLVRSIAADTPDVRLDRVHFKGFGDSSLDFEVVYYVTHPDFNRYMDAQQSMNLAMMDAFAEHDIGFAFPTRTLMLPEPLRLQRASA
ncbi:mechanosensitive ion channel family protein [Luteibacter yeojuensis]|uniref:Mechanosensitive ion channel family protein n=2 Tax=Luteibacter yeojuensis TaxID=345309 RepID=A0A7X5TQA6_9GAMM|nr:mechanosensitive ion channel family protein [Luteibacter yeojuensis]